MIKIQCLECGKYFKSIVAAHLKKCCGLSTKQYREKYPNAEIIGEEVKKNIGIGQKESYENGRIHPKGMLGKNHRPESCKKISENQKGKKLSDETKKNIGNGNRGKKRTTEQKLNASIAQKKSFENGREPWNKGLTNCFSEKTIEQMSESQKESYRNGRINPMQGKKCSDKTRKKIGDANRGRKHSDITKQKQRTSTIDYLESCIGQLSPRYNKNACGFFHWLNETFNLNGYHAENMGEYHIKELGYFVDYYEPDLNLVIEYDESYHFDFNNNLKQRDVQRQREITDFLSCKFIRIKENDFKDFDEILEYIKNNEVVI